MTPEHTYAEMVRQAGHGNTDFINGKALGKNPKYFIIGDEPGFKDYITATPFSGPMQEVLTNCVQTLGKRYGAKQEECYVTYLIKTSFKPGVLTEVMVKDEWLPIAQLEYAMSGCQQVVAIGRISKMFAQHITVRPSFAPPPKDPHGITLKVPGVNA